MKKFILLSLLCTFSLNSWAQEATEDNSNEPTVTDEAPALAPATSATKPRTRPATSLSYFTLGVGYILWNQDLRLQQSGLVTSAPANYQGMTLNIQRETIYRRWGWSVAGIIGSGRANGGDPFDPSITYSQTKQAWTMFAVSPRIFYRLSGRVNFGLSVPVMARQVEWTSSTPGLTVDGGKNFMTSATADLAVRLSNKWELYQGIGPISANGETLWRVNLNYRL